MNAWARCYPMLLVGIACGTAGSPAPRPDAGQVGSSGGAAGSASALGQSGTPDSHAGAQNSAGSLGTAGSAGAATLPGAAGLGGSAAAGGQPSTVGTGGAGSGGQTSGGQAGQEPLPEGVPATYHVVYQQTFATSGSLGDLVLANPTEWRFDNAGFVESTGISYKPPYRSPFSVAIVKSIQVGSFVMDAELLQTSPDGDGHRDMVLIWSFVGPAQFYYAHISTAHDSVAHNIHIVDNADRTAISTSFTNGYDWGRNVWKRLRVVRDATQGSMAVYDLDGPKTPILAASDTRLKSGYLGFGSFDNTGRIRNVKVWAETATPGNPHFFE